MFQDNSIDPQFTPTGKKLNTEYQAIDAFRITMWNKACEEVLSLPFPPLKQREYLDAFRDTLNEWLPTEDLDYAYEQLCIECNACYDSYDYSSLDYPDALLTPAERGLGKACGFIGYENGIT
jgi:hypothetical protein